MQASSEDKKKGERRNELEMRETERRIDAKEQEQGFLFHVIE